MIRPALLAAASVVVACATSAPPPPCVSQSASSGQRCQHGCSLGEVCVRSVKGEHCDTLADDCASPEVADARATLDARKHDYERQKDLFDQHASGTGDLEAAEDGVAKAKADLARAEYASVPRCNDRCSAAVCGSARCVAAPGVIECVAP